LQKLESKSLDKTDKRKGRLAAVWREASDQRALASSRAGPVLDVGLRHIQVASHLAQGKDGTGKPGIVGAHRSGFLSRLCRDRRFLASPAQPRAGHNGDMKKVVVYIPLHARADRAAKMRGLLHRLSPHGGNAAEQVKQTRPRDCKG
jgi:hypothetical protein